MCTHLVADPGHGLLLASLLCNATYLMRVIWNHNITYTNIKIAAYAPVRCRTATVRASWVVLGVIGVYSIIHLLAQLQLAGENDHF